MARYIRIDPDQMEMVPVKLSEQIVPGTLEHTIHYVVTERLDMRAFDQEYKNDEKGRPAYDPRTLLKVVLLGYSRGLLSSRKIEKACSENITFMAIAYGQCPDHSTIADFVSGMGKERIAQLFSQVLLVCEEEGLLGGTHFSMDGYRLTTNASKEWSGTHANLRKKKEKLEELVRESVGAHIDNDKGGQGAPPPKGGKKTREEKLRRKAEKIEKFLAQEEPRKGHTGKEVQSNVTDNESAKMKTSKGMVQGYNANAMVDSANQVVVHAEAFGEGTDCAAAGPMLEGTAANLETWEGGTKLEGAVVTADTNYFSGRNLEACEKAGVNAYIPDQYFRSRNPAFDDAGRHRRPIGKHKKPKKDKRETFGPEEFWEDEETGHLVCPAGYLMQLNGQRNTTAKGYVTTTYRAPADACPNCRLKEQCLRNPGQRTPRQVRIFHDPPEPSLAAQMKDKIDTPEGRKLYSQRLGNVEPVFANIGAHKGMGRSTLRGKDKVNIQWKLYCLVHNLGKIARNQQGRN